jgi:hypothetical protein
MSLYFIIYFLLLWRFTTCTVQSKHKIPCLSPVTQNKKRSHAHTAVKKTLHLRERKRDSAVGIVTRIWAGSRGSIPRKGVREFSP